MHYHVIYRATGRSWLVSHRLDLAEEAARLNRSRLQECEDAEHEAQLRRLWQYLLPVPGGVTRCRTTNP